MGEAGTGLRSMQDAEAAEFVVMNSGETGAEGESMTMARVST